MYKVGFLCVFRTELLVCIFGKEPSGSALARVKKTKFAYYFTAQAFNFK